MDEVLKLFNILAYGLLRLYRALALYCGKKLRKLFLGLFNRIEKHLG